MEPSLVTCPMRRILFPVLFASFIYDSLASLRLDIAHRSLSLDMSDIESIMINWLGFCIIRSMDVSRLDVCAKKISLFAIFIRFERDER